MSFLKKVITDDSRRDQIEELIGVAFAVWTIGSFVVKVRDRRRPQITNNHSKVIV